jgi:hypothetical protein
MDAKPIIKRFSAWRGSEGLEDAQSSCRQLNNGVSKHDTPHISATYSVANAGFVGIIKEL